MNKRPFLGASIALSAIQIPGALAASAADAIGKLAP